MASVVAYVDGFNLYHGLHAKYGRRYLWLDLEHLVQRIRPKDRIVAVRYFTALVRDDPAALARQHIYLEALRVHTGGTVKVVLGRYQSKTRTCPGAFTIAAADLRNSLLPETVSDAAADRFYTRPGKWR